MKSVYSAVRSGSLNKAVCASSLKGGGEEENTNHDLWYEVARVRGRRRNFCSSNELCASSGISTFPWRRDFKIRGKIIRTLTYPDDFVILSKEETVLGGVIGRLVEVGRICGNGNECRKTCESEDNRSHFCL